MLFFAVSRKRFLLLLLASGLALKGACAQAAFPCEGQINSGNINIRADSTVGSQVISTLNKGSRVEVVSELYGWYKIRLPQYAPSYIKKIFVTCIDNAVPPNTTCKKGRVSKERVNIRMEPSESSWILGKTLKDEQVNIISEKGEWYKIEPSRESFGWVNKKFVNIIEKKK